MLTASYRLITPTGYATSLVPSFTLQLLRHVVNPYSSSLLNHRLTLQLSTLHTSTFSATYLTTDSIIPTMMTIVFMGTRHFHSASERRRIPNCYFKTRHRSSYGYYFQVNKLPRFLEARATYFFLLTLLSTNNTIPINRPQPASILNIVIRRPWLSLDILSHAKSYIEASCLV